MQKIEILFLNTLNDYWKNKVSSLQKEFPEVKFIANNNSSDRAKCLSSADAVVSGRLNEQDIDNAPNLKTLFVPFTGLDTFALDKLRERGITVYNTHSNAGVVAEHAVALALALLGRVVEFHNELQKGFWHMSIEDKDMWTSLQGKTCCIIGMGHIGQAVAKLLKSFNCKVIGVKRNLPEKNPGFADEVTVSLTNAIAKSEIIFVCLPLTDDTEGLINEEVFSNMKGKYLINVGRGKTIDEKALYDALKNGALAGAAIDVWYNYPSRKNPEPVFPSKFPFHELPNVILSPHKSSHTTGAIRTMIDDTIENLRNYLSSTNVAADVAAGL